MNNSIQESTGDLIRDLRAALFWKDAEKTSLRPLGMPESDRRSMCRVWAVQERPDLEHFYTNRQPEDEAEWRAECHLAELAATRADEALATAEQCAPQHAEARRADAAAAHQHADTTAIPPNYPANFAFSPNSCALTYESVQAGATAYPDDENLSDDKVAMYNMTSRTATFE